MIVNLNSQFLFQLGDKIKDKEVNDVRLVVGRMMDVDAHNTEIYIIRNSSGSLDWIAAESAHNFYTNLI
ncbi:MAG: hypothetical protein ACXW1D_00440 [Halobacteriota archaeon]